MKYFDMGMFPVKCGYAKNAKVYAKEMKRLGVKRPSAYVREGKAAEVKYFESNGATLIILCINKRKNRSEKQFLALLAHETVHVWQECKEVMGVKENDREVEAHAIQWIYQQFLYNVKRK